MRTITLCGSTRFKAAFIDMFERLTDKGYIVLTVGRFLPKSDHNSEHKKMLDELHFRKIDISDGILVLDIDGYIGESTSNEIAHAKAMGKEVRYLSELEPGYKEPPLEEMDIGKAILGDTVEVMRTIAALDDEGGNRHLAETRSYSRFDEPGSTELARHWLKQRNLL